MKRIVVILLVIILSFSSCGVSEDAVKKDSEPSGLYSDVESSPDTETIDNSVSILDAVRERLNEKYSYEVNRFFLNLAKNGFEETIIQRFAKDDSFTYDQTQRIWDHEAGSDNAVRRLFYYRYEGNDFVCYMKIDDQDTTRNVLDEETITEIRNSEVGFLSSYAILPEYLTDFIEMPSEIEGERVFSFILSVSDIKKDAYDSYVSSYLNAALDFSEIDADKEPLFGYEIKCELKTDDELYPVSIEYDFSSLATLTGSYVLYDGNDSLLNVQLSFDFDLPNTIEMPDELK